MDRKRRLMENNNGWPLRNQLFDGAPIALPLTHTVIGRGGLTPSFTRATTETGQKWDETGYLDFTALAGEMVFKGARREYNQWTTSSVSLANGANKSLTLAAGTYQFSMGAGTGTATFSGTGGATGTLAASTGRVSVAKTISAGTFVVTASVADLADLQVCNITGETDQTTIRPYVSVGVESAPAYHGSMVDGVKCFDTDRSGNLIATTGNYPIVGYVPWEARTNLCLQSNAFTTTWTASGPPTITKNVVGPDGATSAWTLTDGTGGADHIISGNITFTAAAYTASVFIKKTVGATTFPVLWMIDAGSTTISLCTADTNNGVATVWTANGFGLAMMAGASARCSSYNDNYWRFELTATGTAVAYNFKFGPALTTTANQSSGTFSAATTGSAVFYGAQVELGSSATSYIPTTTTAVARNADALTYTGGDIANIKTLACSFRREAGVSVLGAVTGVNDNTFNHYNYCYLNSATQFKFEGYAGGVEQWNTTASNAYTPGTQFKAASSTATNSILMDLNGTAQTADTVATVPVVTRLDVGHIEGGSQLNGNVGGIYGWTRNLSQSELAAVDR